MPLLMYLGAKLGDRINVHLFQRHRDTCDWKWKDETSAAEYAFKCVRNGTARDRVALVLSLSGTIEPAELPTHIDDSYSVYEISLTSATPNTGFLRTREDLVKFRKLYREALAEIQSRHGKVDTLALFPAVPVPIAVAVGMDRLPKVSPSLDVYDYDKGYKPLDFRFVLRVP